MLTLDAIGQYNGHTGDLIPFPSCPACEQDLIFPITARTDVISCALISQTWMSEGQANLLGNGGLKGFTDTNDAPQRVYRLRVALP